MEVLTRYPLEIFPTEIWEMIILEVKESEDLRNLMKASKQLSNIFVKIRHLWLLDKVLPILVPTTKPKSKQYLDVKDLNNLRLVDKRWSRAVNAFLENQPKLRPYKKSDSKLNSSEHIWSESCIEYNNYYKEEPEIGRTTFSSYSDLSQFRRTFKNSKRNPFPARSVFRKTQPDYKVDSLLIDEEKLEFWREMGKEVFRKHGKHIWFLRMMWDRYYFQFHQSRADSVWRWIVKSLSSLPNLKGLHLDFKNAHESSLRMDNSDAEEFLQLEENHLPQMEFLESLKIIPGDALPELFTKQLLSKYSMQLRMLQISTTLLETREKWTFPNLAELHIDYINIGDNLTQILTSLEAPLLTKLQFLCSKGVINNYNAIKIDIFEWIALFPSLLHLNMPCAGFDIRESGAFGNPQDSNYSLKYLKISRSRDVKYNFLRYLPNLQQLQICSGRGVNKIFCKLHVWELCPKLRTFLVTEHFSEMNYQVFCRESYEKLQLERRTGPAESPLYSYENLRRSGRTKRN